MFNSYDFDDQNNWSKQDCNCKTCNKEIEALKERCMLAEGEIVSTEDLVKTFTNIKKGEDAIITIAEDLVLPEENKITIPAGSKVTVNLNGKKIATEKADILFRVNGELTIDGGSVEGPSYVASVNKGGKAIVKGGNYNTEVTCFQANGGEIIIEGGYFQSYSEKFGNKYLLNHIDSKKNEGSIKVIGGKFVNFNPAASESEDPVMNFVPKGYKVVETVEGENTIYEVVKEK